MFAMITPTTALVVGAIALIVFGPKQLPELAKGLGKALGEFKKGLSGIDETDHAAPPASAQGLTPPPPPPSEAAPTTGADAQTPR